MASTRGRLLASGVGPLLVELLNGCNVAGLDWVEGSSWLHYRGSAGVLEPDCVAEFVFGRIDDSLGRVAVVSVEQVAGV